MALNIPMPDLPGEALMKGLKTGSELMHNMMLNRYYGEIHPSGDVANAMYVENLRKQYGDNDPRYLSAKRAHDLVMQGRQSLMDYRQSLEDTAGARATSPLGKELNEAQGRGAQDIIDRRHTGGTVGGTNSGYSYDSRGNNVVATPQEVENVSNGLNPDGSPRNTVDNNPRTPEEREAYERSINKKTSDAAARNTLLRAENLDKTRNAINVDDLTRYSGLKGTGKWLYDSAQAARGNPSDEFIKHQEAVGAATLMADQMRQFYGDSIQPSAMERLRHLANPSTWYKDPKVAKAQWQQLNRILDTETETYRKHGTSPIKLNKIEFKNGNFELGKAPKEPDIALKKGEDSVYDMKAVVPQLMAINPQYTLENIRATAIKRKTSIDNVINQLFQKHAGAQ